jgi:GNAT superfamily N-acetyltransferase
LVEQVRPDITFPLRRRVLRAGLHVSTASFPGDQDRSSGHFAAYVDDRVVGVASVLEEPETDGPGQWRLRGMAVDPDHQGAGTGSALIERVRDFVAGSGGGLIWCNARLTAVGFYDKQGFVHVGEPWDEPGTGPHVRMHDRPERAQHLGQRLGQRLLQIGDEIGRVLDADGQPHEV